MRCFLEVRKILAEWSQTIIKNKVKNFHHRGTESTEVYFVSDAYGVANNKKPFSVYSVPLWWTAFKAFDFISELTNTLNSQFFLEIVNVSTTGLKSRVTQNFFMQIDIGFYALDIDFVQCTEHARNSNISIITIGN